LAIRILHVGELKAQRDERNAGHAEADIGIVKRYSLVVSENAILIRFINNLAHLIVNYFVVNFHNNGCRERLRIVGDIYAGRDVDVGVAYFYLHATAAVLTCAHAPCLGVRRRNKEYGMKDKQEPQQHHRKVLLC